MRQVLNVRRHGHDLPHSQQPRTYQHNQALTRFQFGIFYYRKLDRTSSDPKTASSISRAFVLERVHPLVLPSRGSHPFRRPYRANEKLHHLRVNYSSRRCLCRISRYISMPFRAPESASSHSHPASTASTSPTCPAACASLASLASSATPCTPCNPGRSPRLPPWRAPRRSWRRGLPTAGP